MASMDEESAVTEEPNVVARFVSNAGAAGLGASVGLVVAGPLGGLVGGVASQAAVDLTGLLWQRIGEKRRLKAARVLDEAAANLGRDVEAVVEELASDDDLTQVTATVLIGAVASQAQEKLHAYGQVLTNVLNDRATVDEELFIAQALNALEAPHIRLLGALERASAGSPVRQEILEQDAQMGIAFQAVLKTVEAVGVARYAPVIEGRAVGLQRGIYGLAELPTTDVTAPHWQTTQLGVKVMARLREAEQQTVGSA